jgi:hypothetical protein
MLKTESSLRGLWFPRLGTSGRVLVGGRGGALVAGLEVRRMGARAGSLVDGRVGVWVVGGLV